MSCPAGDEVRTRGKVPIQRLGSLRGEPNRGFEIVASQTSLALCVVDKSSLGARGPGGSNPALETVRPTGGQEVIERGSKGLAGKGWVMRYLGHAQRLVPPAHLE